MCSAVVCWRVVKDGDRNCSNSSMPLVIVIAGGKYVLSQNSGVDLRCFQDVYQMCESLEKVFNEKIAKMPAEV